MQQRSATCQDDTLIDNVGGKLGLRVFQRDADRVDDPGDWLADRLGNLHLRDFDLLGDAIDEVAALDGQRQSDAIGRRYRSSDTVLDPLRRRLADQQIVVTPDIRGYGFVHLVAANAHRIAVGKAAQGQNRDFRGAAANIHHHRAQGFGNRHARANGRSHWLLDEVNLRRARVRRRVPDRAALNRCRA